MCISWLTLNTGMAIVPHFFLLDWRKNSNSCTTKWFYRTELQPGFGRTLLFCNDKTVEMFLFSEIIDLDFSLHMVFTKYGDNRYVVKISSVACPWDFWCLLRCIYTMYFCLLIIPWPSYECVNTPRELLFIINLNWQLFLPRLHRKILP